MARCRRCGAVYVDHVPSREQLDAYYGDYPIKEELSPITAMRYDALLDGMDAFRRTGRLIEVGAGGGGFLGRAALRGWEVHGTEYGARTVEALRQRGFHMRQGPLDAAGYPPGSFDVLVSLEVIEHVIDPRHEVAQMHALLRPGGLLYITTPNFNALTRRFSGGKWTIVNYPEHLTLFTPSALDGLLRRTGFERIALHTTGASLSRFKESHHIGDQKANEHAVDDERLRRSIERSMLLRGAKAAVNAALDLTRLGDTLKATYRKIGSDDQKIRK